MKTSHGWLYWGNIWRLRPPQQWTDHCLETLEQYGFGDLAETFLEVDENKENIITKEEGENAAIKMMGDFDRCNWRNPF